MTDQQINETIAKECGWFHESGYTTGGMMMPYSRWRHPLVSATRDNPPDYTTSLDACAEMEKTLTDGEHRIFIFGYLIDTVGNHRLAYSATARQRSEAFLRVKGKWPSMSEGKGATDEA